MTHTDIELTLDESITLTKRELLLLTTWFMAVGTGMTNPTALTTARRYLDNAPTEALASYLNRLASFQAAGNTLREEDMNGL